jgi:hypothetical protein
VSPPHYEDGRNGVWRFHIQTYKMTSRKWGYDSLFPWIERGPFFDEASDFMICRKRVTVALTFADQAKPAGSGPPWVVLILSTPNLSIRPLVDRFMNGHEAFLCALEMEIDDVCLGLREASEKIGSAAIPPVCCPACLSAASPCLLRVR